MGAILLTSCLANVYVLYAPSAVIGKNAAYHLEFVSNIVVTVCYFVLLEVLKWRKTDNNIYVVLGYVLTIILAGSMTDETTLRVMATYVGYLLPSVCLLLYAKEDLTIRKLSFLMYAIGLIVGIANINSATPLYSPIIFAITQIGYMVYFALFMKKYGNSEVGKTVYYFTSLAMIAAITIAVTSVFKIDCSNIWVQLCIYALFALFGLFVQMSSYTQKWSMVRGVLKDKNLPVGNVYPVNRIFNYVMLVVGLYYMNAYYNFAVGFLLLLVTSVQCFYEDANIFKNSPNGGYIVAIKATVYINLVMYLLSRTELGYVYSIACLIIAIASIIIGFIYMVQSLRMYGLCLSIGSVLKMMLFDIKYEDSMGRVFGYIASGILCFVIVWIYNRMQAKLKEKGN